MKPSLLWLVVALLWGGCNFFTPLDSITYSGPPGDMQDGPPLRDMPPPHVADMDDFGSTSADMPPPHVADMDDFGSVPADMPPPPPDYLRSRHVSEDFEVDAVTEKKQYEGAQAKALRGKNNFAYVRSAWSDEKLYVFYEVTDSILSQTQGDVERAWRCDAIDLFLDPREDGASPKKLEIDMGPGPSPRLLREDDVQLAVDVWENFYGSVADVVVTGKENAPGYLKFYSRKTSKGYNIEVSIAWSALKNNFLGVPPEGAVFGILLGASDCDTKSEAGFYINTTYSWPADLPTFRDPDLWGKIKLVGKSD